MYKLVFSYIYNLLINHAQTWRKIYLNMVGTFIKLLRNNNKKTLTTNLVLHITKLFQSLCHPFQSNYQKIHCMSPIMGMYISLY